MTQTQRHIHEPLTPQDSADDFVGFPCMPDENNDARRRQNRSKRFSLQTIQHVFVKDSKTATARPRTAAASKVSAMKNQTKSATEPRKETNHVTFSPSTDDKEAQRLTREGKAGPFARIRRLSLRSAPVLHSPTLQRSHSHDGSIGRAQARLMQQPLAGSHRRARSISFSKKGIQLQDPAHATSKGKGGLAVAKVSRRQASAARHARVLERIINAGTSIELEELKAKRMKKLGAQVNERSKVQLYPVVSPRRIKALKAALTNQNCANEIIDELRFMQLDRNTVAVASGVSLQSSEAQHALHDIVDGEERKRQRMAPLKAVCLDCTDEEAARRSEAARSNSAAGDKKQEQTSVETVVAVATSTGLLGAALERVSMWWRPSSGGPSRGALGDAVEFAYEIEEDVRQGDVKEAMADTARLGTAGLTMTQPTIGSIVTKVETFVLPKNKVPGEVQKANVVNVPTATGNATIGSLSSVSPISLLTSPRTTIASLGVQQSGAIDALASLSGAAVATARGGQDAMLEVRPPTDRMSIFVYWWGFEITLPEPSMSYLGTAHSVSGAFMGFLQTMVTTGGVPELLPFIRYISSFMEMEFSAIKSQDRDRHGVVIAATWLMPLALVPRPWDYGGYDDKRAQATSQTSAFKHTPRETIGTEPELPALPSGAALPVLPVKPPSTSRNAVIETTS